MAERTKADWSNTYWRRIWHAIQPFTVHLVFLNICYAVRYFPVWQTLSIFLFFPQVPNRLSSLYRLHMSNNPQSSIERAGRFLVLAACWSMTVLVCLSRTYLQYHTWGQVIVGSIIGSITGFSWFLLIHLIVTPLFPTIASWFVPNWNLFENRSQRVLTFIFFLLPSRKLSEYLLLRDTTLIPNILWFEYTITRQEARVRTRKMHKKWQCWLVWHAASIKLTLLQFCSNRWRYVYRTKSTSEN